MNKPAESDNVGSFSFPPHVPPVTAIPPSDANIPPRTLTWLSASSPTNHESCPPLQAVQPMPALHSRSGQIARNEPVTNLYASGHDLCANPTTALCEPSIQ